MLDARAVAGQARAYARAGALLPARAAVCGLGWALFRARDLGSCDISLLLSANNYIQQTTGQITEA